MGGLLGWVGWTLLVLALCRLVGQRRVNRQLVERVAYACHEIRGPLAAARLGLHAPPGPLPAARERGVGLELDRAALALDDLSAAASLRPHGGAPGGLPAARVREVAAVEVRQLLAESVAAWSAVAAARGVELELAPAEPQALVVDGDRLRLAQATGNLLANAVEHGGGTVTARCRALGCSVRIEVSDTGSGLPEPVDRLLRRPQRAGRARGRGLAVAAEVAANHGGRLAAAPVERGARLVLELPRAGGARGSAEPLPS